MKRFFVILILILMFPLFAGCAQTKINIRTHDSQNDTIRFMDIEWLSIVDDVLIALMNKYKDHNYSVENPRGHYMLSDSIGSFSYLFKGRDADDPLIWDPVGKQMKFISVNCINDPNVPFKEKTADDMLLYSATVVLSDSTRAAANEIIKTLNQKYGECEYNKSAIYDIDCVWTDDNSNKIKLMLDESASSLNIEYECGDVRVFADKENEAKKGN